MLLSQLSLFSCNQAKAPSSLNVMQKAFQPQTKQIVGAGRPAFSLLQLYRCMCLTPIASSGGFVTNNSNNQT